MPGCVLFNLESFVDIQHISCSRVKLRLKGFVWFFNQGFSGYSLGIPHNIADSLISLQFNSSKSNQRIQ